MKKVFRNLLILSISVTGLSGCNLFSTISGGDVETKEEKAIELRDYTKTVVQDASYTFDGKVFLKYEDESEKEVTSECSFDYTYLDTSKIGSDSYFNVKYEGKQYIFNKKAYLSVVAKVTKIEVSNYSTSVKKDAKYTFSGTVIATYSDGKTKNVSTLDGLKVSTIDTSSEGNKDLEISYTENGVSVSKTVSIKVYSERSKLTKIAASGYTTKANKNDAYSFDGVVTATFENGSTEVVTSECTYSYDGNFTKTAGTKSFTVRYETFYTNSSGQEISIYKTTTVSIQIISHVESITLETPSLEVGVGRSKSISASVNPSDATNQGLNFVSNNTNIATVDADGKVKGIAIGQTTITVSSKENSNITATVNVNVVASSNDNWTIMVYMCGADLESQGGYATKDIKEILGISGQPEDVNILIETGGSNSWSLQSSYISGATSISSSQLGRWYVRNNKLNFVENLASASMGKTSTYQSFLSWGINNYPADNYGVILWNHGGGLDGVCYDEKFSDDSLLNSEMKSAHSNVIGSDKFTFIGYDACLMQNMEIADYNASYFEYQVASQESEAGDGWYYTSWIDDVYDDKPITTILKSTCDGFISSVGSSSDQTLSYLDLSKLSSFKTAFESYASALKSQLSSKNVSASTFSSYVKNSIKGYSEPGYGGYGQFDVKDFVTKLQSQTNYKVDASYADAVTTALTSLVGYNKIGTGAGQSNGISLTYKCSSYSSYDANEMNFPNWESFNSSYGSTSGGSWY